MRTLVLIDGQNLFHLARRAWAPVPLDPSSPYAWPSYDVEKLARTLVERVPGRTTAEIRFYTGVPNASTQWFWHGFWSNKLRHLRNRGIKVYRGRINEGGQEKGVDVSLALDLVQATHEQRYDAAIIVSQDWDFGPAVHLAKMVARAQGRELVFESAFPFGPRSSTRRGVPGTTWVRIDKATYDACRDSKDYRPHRP
ncbi:MAG: NYN domain-containing protein [Dehalococcoidia bacterium]|nr:NYN domain-containing protein [Dehalococcoidia bacterium]MYA52823.1 NYN domain-containing protein [Dehalococcoidia bacterium]